MKTERNGTTDTGVKFLASGVRISEEGETATRWWVFDNAEVARVVGWFGNYEDADERESLAYDLTGETDYYSGPGRGFADRPFARVGKYHTLVTQHTGLDV